MAWVAWAGILAWVAWVHKIGIDPNFGIGQKNGLREQLPPSPSFERLLKVPFSINIYLYTIFVKFLLYERLLIHAGSVIILTQSQTPLM